MNERNLNLNDLVRLEKDAKFPLPNLNDRLYVIKRSIEENEKLLASFWVKLTSELSLVIDSSLGPLTRARIVNYVDNLSPELKKIGVDDLHLFIEDRNFSDFLVRHFNFVKVPGEALYKKL